MGHPGTEVEKTVEAWVEVGWRLGTQPGADLVCPTYQGNTCCSRL